MTFLRNMSEDCYKRISTRKDKVLYNNEFEKKSGLTENHNISNNVSAWNQAIMCIHLVMCGTNSLNWLPLKVFFQN